MKKRSALCLVCVEIVTACLAHSAPSTQAGVPLWPKAPLNGKPLRYRYNPKTQETATIALQGPTVDEAKDDWVQVNEQKEAKGLLSYAGRVGPFPRDGENQYTVLRGVGVQGKINGVSTSSAYYHFSRDWYPWGTQLSKDGSTLLSRVGIVDRHETFTVYRWHLPNGGFNLVGRARVESWDAFSDDGNYWAYVQTLSQDESALALMPSDLFVNDTRKEYSSWLVTRLASGRQPVWNSVGQLLYSHEPVTSVLRTDNIDGRVVVTGVIPTPVIDAPNKYPSVWIADPKTKTTHSLIERAYNPSPSPDGKYIAFFGWDMDEKPTDKQVARAPRLRLWEVATGKRYNINPQNNGFVGWTRDSQTIVTGRYEGSYELHVGSFPLRNVFPGNVPLSFRFIEKATVQTEDEGIGGERDWPPAIVVQGVARSGKYVVVSTEHFLPQTDRQGPLNNQHRMLAVDLDDGHITEIAHAKPNPSQFFTWSWFDLSDAPANGK